MIPENVGGVETGERPRGAELIFSGDLNVDLERTGGRRLDELIAVAVATVGLEDISAHFLLRQRAWDLYQRPWEVVKVNRRRW